MEQQPNYYSILPANVRYDKRLKANEKLLFSEITALSNKKGFCHASNAYFAELYGVTKVTISGWINHLKDCGYLKIKTTYQGKQISGRTLTPVVDPIKEKVNTPIKEKVNPLLKKTLTPYSKKVYGGIKENFKGNNTSINTTRENTTSKNNIYSPAGPPDEFAEQRAKIIGYLNKKLDTHYRQSSAKAKRHIDARLKEGYTLDDFIRVIDNKISDWANDQRMAKYLRPETLFGSKFDSYLNEKQAAQPLITNEERDGHFG